MVGCDVGAEDALLCLLSIDLEGCQWAGGATDCHHLLLIESSCLHRAVMTRGKARILIVITVHACIHGTVLRLVHLRAERLLRRIALMVRSDDRWGFQRGKHHRAFLELDTLGDRSSLVKLRARGDWQRLFYRI